MSLAEKIAKNLLSQTAKRPRSLENYVEVVRRIKLDPWQRHMCGRLEEEFWLAQYEEFEPLFTRIDIGTAKPFQLSPSGLKIDQDLIERRHGQGCRIAIHAPPQFGKSSIISQCYPGWVLGWQPMHRFRLATYSILHSARFSMVVKHQMASIEHRTIFPDPEGWVPDRSRVTEWSTAARMKHPDGQASFAALGLESGFTGTGFDTLIMDDPYKGDREAMSEGVRDKVWQFWEKTASPRAIDTSNVWIMFHRYHQDDQAGRALATGDFDLIRYAAEADGDYFDEESNLTFPDPLGRKDGEFLSPRRSELYYKSKKKDEDTWYSQFQGRPSAASGKMFNVSMLQTIHPDAVPEILFRVRAWDNPSTEGGGAYTAGADVGVDAAEIIYVFDMARGQVGTAERQELQEDTANKDGKLVHIHAPQDPGSAGVDVAFDFEQELGRKGYLVVTKKVTGTKTDRARPFSKAVNQGRVRLVLNKDGSVPEWHKEYKKEFRYFPNSTYKDQVDCSSDGYTYLMKLIRRGLVVKNAGVHNLLHRTLFTRRFGMDKAPGTWQVEAAVVVAKDSSRPSGYAIVARAADSANIGEAVFILAAERMYVNEPIRVLDALRVALGATCQLGVKQAHTIWLNKGAGSILQVTAQKMDMHVTEFPDEANAGIPETNYYFQPIPGMSPFYNRMGTTRCFAVVDDIQYEEEHVIDDRGMLSLRQDWQSWSYTDRGEVQPNGGVILNCVRMTLYKFALSATSLSPVERRMAKLDPKLQPQAIQALLGTPQYLEALWAQEHAMNQIRIQEEDEQIEERRPKNGRNIGTTAVVHRFRRIV